MQTNKLEILKREQLTEIEGILEKNYGVEFSLKNFLVLKSEREEKIWLASKEIDTLDLRNLPVNSVGMNFGKIKRNDKINLTVEGSQLVGKAATKNIAIINDKEKFLSGSDVEPGKLISCDLNNFVIVKHSGEVLGSGILRENTIENLLPISRRIQFTRSKP